MPQVAAVTVLQPQHVSAAGGGGPHVHGQAGHVGPEHVVVEPGMEKKYICCYLLAIHALFSIPCVDRYCRCR